MPACASNDPTAPPTTARVAEEIVALERAALERWGSGDPSGFLALCAPDVTYFDPFLDRRLDGIEALTCYYEGLRGAIRVEHHEMTHPRVDTWGDVAVLTFDYAGWAGTQAARWNCTEVYRRTAAGWRIVHTHWSRTRPR